MLFSDLRATCLDLFMISLLSVEIFLCWVLILLSLLLRWCLGERILLNFELVVLLSFACYAQPGRLSAFIYCCVLFCYFALFCLVFG